MKKFAVTAGFGLAVCLVLGGLQNPTGYADYWHQWRGPFMTGVSPQGTPPLEWSETKNVTWKVAIPGRGHSTPIIWKDQIFILTAVPESNAPPAPKAEGEQGSRRGMPSRKTDVKHRFVVMSISRSSGKVMWQKTVAEEVPQEATHDLGSWASGSPITDGEFVYAYFGSRGLYCLDMSGNLKWERDFGEMSKRMQFGEGSSPTLYGNTIIVLWDHEGDSFVATLDKKTGMDIWKMDRDEGTSWSTPLVVEVERKPQVITSATNRVRSYDLANGNLIWECSGMTSNVIPTPMEQDGVLYVMSGFRGNALLAIRLAGAKGDITDSDAILWKLDKETPYTPSGLLYQDKLYFLRANNGILSCFDAKTGKEYYRGQRLEGIGNLYTSPVGANGRVYILGQKGTMYVVAHGPEFKILAQNTLEDSFHASPAVVENQIYLRGFEYLYRIEEKQPPQVWSERADGGR